jgi:NTE family protein
VSSGSTNVAIACQGGGSHTAFSAGVLISLLENWQPDHRLVGLSGASGGAFDALAAWYGLVSEGPDRAVEILEAIWEDLSADSIPDQLTNNWLVSMAYLEDTGVPLPRFSPYTIAGSKYGKQRIRETLQRYVDFDAIEELSGPSRPELVIGTVDVNAGEFETFVNDQVTPDAILASAAVPRLFEAVEIHGDDHWDGLFSQNPPIDDLLKTDAERKPDEIWVIQVNPQHREETPTEPEEIADRRNELAGNLSLNQELKFIERVNEWVEAGYLPEEDFSHTEIRRVTMDRDYSVASKMDRSPSHIDELLEYGKSKATELQEE